MIRHLLKLVWNRKRSNALLILEDLRLVPGGVRGGDAAALLSATTAGSPLGFDWQDVWNVASGSPCRRRPRTMTATPSRRRCSRGCCEEVRSFPGVEAAAAAVVSLRPTGGSSGSWTIDGNGRADGRSTRSTTGFADVLGLKVVAGRWFQEADAALAWEPVVIDRELARDGLSAPRDPSASRFGEPEPDERRARVIGVVSDFRKYGRAAADGQLHVPAHASARDPSSRPPAQPPGPGAPGHAGRRSRRRWSRRMQAVAPDWSFEVQPLAQMRATSFRFFLTPLIVAGTVAFFLLLMVGLGLIGVLWQNLLQRTREIGLRRAAGASRAGGPPADPAGAAGGRPAWASCSGSPGGPDPGARPDRRALRPRSSRAGCCSPWSPCICSRILCALYPSTLATRGAAGRGLALRMRADDPDRRRRPVGDGFAGPPPQAARPPHAGGPVAGGGAGAAARAASSTWCSRT